MIRIVVLGTSASMPTKDSWPSCFAIKHGDTLLFDACEGVQRQMMRHGISYASVKAIFLSHLHADHFLGIFGLMQSMNMAGRKEELQVFGPRGTKKLLEQVLAARELAPAFPVKISDAEAGKVFENPLFQVRAFEVRHYKHALGYCLEEENRRNFDEEKCRKLGIAGRMFGELQKHGVLTVKGKKIRYDDVSFEKKGKKIVYTGDTKMFAGLAKEFKDADLVIGDATFSDAEKDMAHEKEHCTAKELAEAVKKAGAKKLLLTHFSNRYDDRRPLLDEAKKEFGESFLAEEGLELMV